MHALLHQIFGVLRSDFLPWRRRGKFARNIQLFVKDLALYRSLDSPQLLAQKWMHILVVRQLKVPKYERHQAHIIFQAIQLLHVRRHLLFFPPYRGSGFSQSRSALRNNYGTSPRYLWDRNNALACSNNGRVNSRVVAYRVWVLLFDLLLVSVDNVKDLSIYVP